MSSGVSHVSTAVAARRASLAAPIACGCCLVAGAAYVAANDPSGGGVFIPCPFRELTGLWCVGCGLTRATHHLLRGNLGTALHFNLLVIPVLAAIVLAWLSWALTTAGRPTRLLPRLQPWAYAVLITAALAFAVVRNMPGVDGLRG